MSTAPQLLTAPYGNTAIPFSLRRKKRKTLGIRVTPQGKVEVSAPTLLAEAEIIRLVTKRGAWILRHQRELAKLPPPLPPLQYVSGESWRYLGRQYRLRVLTGSAEGVQLTNVQLASGELWLTARAPERAQQVLTAWLRAQAQAVLAERVAYCLSHAAAYGLHHSGEFTLRAMRTRWGSLSSSGRMTLNLYLIHAPTECIDFVILHELCHLREFNHSKAYYALLTRVLPDWKRRRALLNTLVELPRLESHAAITPSAPRPSGRCTPRAQPLALGQ